MKRYLVIMLLACAMAVPGMAFSQDVAAGGGSISLHAHIDFVGRFSAEDDDDDYNGYESYNLEFAVIGLAGTIGDNVSWVLTEATAFAGPAAGLQTWGASNLQAMGGGANNNAVGSSLLDARINFHMGEYFMVSMGRFIPPTSMTWNPHLMKVMHTINYPLMNGSGFQGGGGLMVPLPMYQTGVMLSIYLGPVTFMAGNFNGTDVVGGIGNVMPLGMNNIVDIDKTKGTQMKLAFDAEGFHIAGWYYGEEASVTLWNPAMVNTLTPKAGRIREDGTIQQWGVEFDMNTELVFAQAQYLNTRLDMDDENVDDLWQAGWYVLLGMNVTDQFQLLGRYDFMDYDNEEVLISDRRDEEQWAMAGMNYLVNENVTVGVNYTWRWLENEHANLNELAFITEMNLF